MAEPRRDRAPALEAEAFSCRSAWIEAVKELRDVSEKLKKRDMEQEEELALLRVLDGVLRRMKSAMPVIMTETPAPENAEHRGA